MSLRPENRRLFAFAIGLAAAGAMLSGHAALAQTANFPSGGAKLPQWSELSDWDSVWERGGDLFVWDDRIPVGVPQTPPYNDEYQKQFAQVRPMQRPGRPGPGGGFPPGGRPPAAGIGAGGNPRAGMPGMMIILRPMEIEVNPHEVLIMIEGGAVRRIYTDGRLHPVDPIVSGEGHSIGYWKNHELFVDTCCFTADTRLPGGGPHSDAMHITEHFYSPKGGMLVDEMSVEDPKAFTKPWTTVKTFYRRPDWELLPPEPDSGGRPGGPPPAQAPAAPAP